MRLFGEGIGIVVGDSSSLASGSISLNQPLPGINFIYFDSRYSSSISTGSIGSLETTITTASEAGVRGELLFRVKNFDNPIETGSVILKLSHTGSNDEPRVGIGFNSNETVEKTFEIKSKKDSTEGTEIILEGSRISVGAQVGDSAGKISFVINSGSFNNKFTSGSIATLDSVVTGINETGVRGHLLIGTSRSNTNPPTPFWRFGYGADPRVGGNFGTITTGSLNIVRPSNAIDEQITLTHTDESYIGLQYITSSVDTNAEAILNSMNFVSTGHNGIIYDYNLWKDGIGGRTGQIMAVMSASIVEMTDVSTPHIGSGTPPSFTTSISNETFQLSITNGDGYIFKAFTKKL